MFNATLKRFLFILLMGTLAGLAGCSNPEEKRAEQIQDALELSETGNHEGAIDLLETLALDYPNDSDILKSMGRIYAREGDHTTAAFFMEQAQAQDPDDVELLYETYQSLEAANLPSGGMLEKLAAKSPETMTKALWVELGRYRAGQNETESALEAYLQGVDPDKQSPVPDTAVAVGQLFAKLDNQAQAENWLEIAADSDSPSALTALFGLLQIQLDQKDWPEAEATIARLNTQFPGAVEASQWQQANEELKNWRTAQEKMKAQFAAEEATEEKASDDETDDGGGGGGGEATDDEATEMADAESSESGEADGADGSEDSGGKSQVVADLEAAEALATQPAREAAEVDPNAEALDAAPSEGEAAAFNPNIAINPADPDLGIEVSFDEESAAPDTRFSVETDDAPTAMESFEPEQILPPVRPAEQPKTLEELLAEAEAAEIDRNYTRAIRKYWAAISIANNRADIWNLLSRAYLVDGQLQNADTTALEAVRLAPREVAYTLDFLRVAQRSRPPEEFLAQLETAYDRFPSSPEITLSLARAHERISKDEFVARNLYLRFIDIAPNHPLRSEAEAAAARLR